MSHTVELFQEPLKIRKNFSENGSEMSELQLAMLCGLIKENRPRKIVEVGVAAGGTTAVIMNCISMLEVDACVYSVDISEQYYRDTSKKTGYLAEECMELLGGKVNHKQYRGVLPQYLGEIGNNIDLLILDTMHILPGEILDFLAAFPYLKDGAIVVLHDIFLNHYNNNINSYATRILFSSLVGEKIIGRGNDNQYNYIELGVIRVIPDTKKYIENVFSALIVTWQYMPDVLQLVKYKEFFEKYYDNQLMEIFNMAVDMNKKTITQKRQSNEADLIGVHDFLEKLKNKEKIVIYGCGVLGKKLWSLLEAFDIKVEGFVLSDNQTKPNIDKRVDYISELDVDKYIIVLGMSNGKQKEVCKRGILENWICIDEHVISFLRNNC